MSNLRKMLFIIVVGLIIALILIASAAYRVFNPTLERQIAGPVDISSQWIEINPDPPLKPSRMEQYIKIYVQDAYTPYKPNDDSWGATWGMRFPDGSVRIPRVQLVDENGTVYNLDSPSFINKDSARGDGTAGMGFTAGHNPATEYDLPQDRIYTTVRIRSDSPIRCSKVVWSCIDRK